MKIILIIGAGLIVILTLALFLFKPNTTDKLTAPTGPSLQETVGIQESGRIANPNTQSGSDVTKLPQEPSGKLKADTFIGILEKVDTGCFADGECYVEVDGKHVTALIGWSQNEVGSVLGVEGFGDLENHIGKKVEVYAQDNSDGTYTLYGSTGFSIKAIE
jgi:hypothetical protein